MPLVVGVLGRLEVALNNQYPTLKVTATSLGISHRPAVGADYTRPFAAENELFEYTWSLATEVVDMAVSG